MSSTPFDNNPNFRKVLYKGQWIISGVMSGTAVGFAAAGNPLPEWYNVTTAVLMFVFTYTGATADNNTLTKIKDVVRAAKAVEPSAQVIVDAPPED